MNTVTAMNSLYRIVLGDADHQSFKRFTGQTGSIHLLAGNLMPEEDKILAYASRITIDGQRGSLASQIENPVLMKICPELRFILNMMI